MLKQFFVIFLVLLGKAGVVYSVDEHDIFSRYHRAPMLPGEHPNNQNVLVYYPRPRQLFPDLGSLLVERMRGYPCYSCAPCAATWCLSGSCPLATVVQISLVAYFCGNS